MEESSVARVASKRMEQGIGYQPDNPFPPEVHSREPGECRVGMTQDSVRRTDFEGRFPAPVSPFQPFE